MNGRSSVPTAWPPVEGNETGLSMSVQDCPSGCVCLSFGAAAIHLQPEEFAPFAALRGRPAETSSKLCVVRFMGLAADALSRMMVRIPMEPTGPEGILVQ